MKAPHRTPNNLISQYSRTVAHENGYRIYRKVQREVMEITEEDLEVIRRAWGEAYEKYKIAERRGR